MRQPHTPRHIAIVLLSLPVLVCTALASQGTGPASGRAPDLSACQLLPERDLGSWDDAFNYPNQDFIVFRRGAELFSYSLVSSSAPQRLATSPALVNSRIVNGVETNGHRWLFVQAPSRIPFALDVMSGRQVSFSIPGARITSDHTTEIQSQVIATHAGGAILMIAGGDPASWPRPENRPVYYWFGLESGQAIQLPIGWDLLWFSSDQKTAVFGKPYGEKLAAGTPQFNGSAVAAVSMASGEIVRDVPDPNRSFMIPFNWSDRDDVKPLFAPFTPQGGQIQYFAGISTRGVAHLIPMNLKAYLQRAAIRADRSWAAFSLRPEGGTSASTLWLAHLGAKEQPRLVVNDPSEFEILGAQRLIYVTSHSTTYDKKESEALVYDVDTGQQWNVLDGIDRLPRLDAATAQKPYIADAMNARLIRGFGSSRYTDSILAIFSHTRMEMVSRPLPAPQPMPTQRWHRAVLISERGTRCTVDMPSPDFSTLFWLHNSGKLVSVREDSSTGARRLRASELAFAQ